jgi:hypothetical protein
VGIFGSVIEISTCAMPDIGENGTPDSRDDFFAFVDMMPRNGIAKLTDFGTDLSLIIGCSKDHDAGWTQVS